MYGHCNTYSVYVCLPSYFPSCSLMCHAREKQYHSNRLWSLIQSAIYKVMHSKTRTFLWEIEIKCLVNTTARSGHHSVTQHKNEPRVSLENGNQQTSSQSRGREIVRDLIFLYKSIPKFKILPYTILCDALFVSVKSKLYE